MTTGRLLAKALVAGSLLTAGPVFAADVTPGLSRITAAEPHDQLVPGQREQRRRAFQEWRRRRLRRHGPPLHRLRPRRGRIAQDRRVSLCATLSR